MERMWRKMNHSLRNSKSQSQSHTHSQNSTQREREQNCAAVVAGVATPQSTDTISSAGGFGDGQLVVAVQGLSGGVAAAAATAGGSNATGRRLANSGQPPSNCPKSLSQHVLQTRTASSERRRRRRRKSRPRRTGGMVSVTSCVGDGGGDNMSSSGGFYTLKEHHQHYRHGHGHHARSGVSTSHRIFATSAPSGTVMMYPNAAQRTTSLAVGGTTTAIGATGTGIAAAVPSAPDISLRQRAVAKLRMFNFHLNWDLQMMHCKPCGPRLSGSGNIITRRLCRNRRREDNELYRSNSFKFERFERKECLEELSNTLQKQIAICDDYSLPVDFVKKRPSSIDPYLADANPDHWIVPSPQTEFLPFSEAQQASQQQQHQQQQPSVATATTVVSLAVAAPPPPTSLATLPSQAAIAAAAVATILGSSNCNNNNNCNNNISNQHNSHVHNNNTLPAAPQQQPQQQQRATLQHPPLPHSNIKQASVKLIEGYSDPKDTRHHSQHKKVFHKKAKRRTAPTNKRQQQQLQTLPVSREQQYQKQQLLQQQQQRHSTYNNNNGNHKKNKCNSHYNSDSSAPKSSDDEADIDEEVEQVAPKKLPLTAGGVGGAAAALQTGALLNSPDSITDDLVRPLPPQLQRSPRKLTIVQSEHSKRQPSPYYYSDLLKSRDKEGDRERQLPQQQQQTLDREGKQKCPQSTATEPPQHSHSQPLLGVDRKSSSLDATQQQEEDNVQAENEQLQLEEDPQTEQYTPKRYSFTEEGVRIIRCETPSTSTSEESDCSECLKRREWHARALALVRKTCNVQPRQQQPSCPIGSGELQLQLQHCDTGEGELLKCCPPAIGGVVELTGGGKEGVAAEESVAEVSMPPHRLLGPAAVCGACIPTTSKSRSVGLGHCDNLDELEEYFRPRSIFYVHPRGEHECVEYAPAIKPSTKTKSNSNLNTKPSAVNEAVSLSTQVYRGKQGDVEEDEEEELEEEEEDEPDSDNMGSRRRQIYETAFDCKIAKSDDDLDEVDRITNHSVLLQLSNGNESPSGVAKPKSRLECKRTKNSKNQALQVQLQQQHESPDAVHGQVVLQVQAELSQMQLLSQVDHQNQNQNQQQQQLASVAASMQQLPARGYTPSPPSTAPLPIKFPGKHERYMNSIKSAPNLPAAQPAHPRLRDLRLPLHSLRHQQQQQQCASSNDNSLTDSAYVNPPSTNSNSAAASVSASVSASASASAAAAATGAAATQVRRPRSFVLESGRVLELRRSAQMHQQRHHHHSHHHQQQQMQPHKPHSQSTHGAPRRAARHAGSHNYSSTESIATSSSGGSMESLRSSTSEGNRSTSSSESRHSSSLSSHSSESGSGSGSASSSIAYPLRAPVLHSKLHILSPISDKSSQEPASVSASEQSQKPPAAGSAAAQDNAAKSTELGTAAASATAAATAPSQLLSSKQRSGNQRSTAPPNKALLHLADELLGSDSGISLHSREDGKPPSLALQRLTLPKLQLNSVSNSGEPPAGAVPLVAIGCGTSSALPLELRDLPFDMPKLRRRKTLQQEANACTSGSATSVDLGELPFDMPKLRRRLRANQAELSSQLIHSTESSGISQASSSHSMRDEHKLASKLDTTLFRQNLTLNLNEPRQSSKQFGSLDLRDLGSHKELNINVCQGYVTAVDLIDVTIPLERQGWYHGSITRIEAETTLRPLAEGTFLVRNCESTKQDYSLSLKGAKGFMHMRIQRNEAGQYILGQFSRPFDTVPDMIRHFCLNRLPVRGAEHMCLIEPVIAQLL